MWVLSLERRPARAPRPLVFPHSRSATVWVPANQLAAGPTPTFASQPLRVDEATVNSQPPPPGCCKCVRSPAHPTLLTGSAKVPAQTPSSSVKLQGSWERMHRLPPGTIQAPFRHLSGTFGRPCGTLWAPFGHPLGTFRALIGQKQASWVAKQTRRLVESHSGVSEQVKGSRSGEKCGRAVSPTAATAEPADGRGPEDLPPRSRPPRRPHGPSQTRIGERAHCRVRVRSTEHRVRPRAGHGWRKRRPARASPAADGLQPQTGTGQRRNELTPGSRSLSLPSKAPR